MELLVLSIVILAGLVGAWILIGSISKDLMGMERDDELDDVGRHLKTLQQRQADRKFIKQIENWRDGK